MIKATAVGRLSKDAEIFTYGQGKTGISFALICNQMGGDSSTYIQCVQFGRDENLAQYLKMGNQLIVHGDLVIEERNGSYYTKIIVSELEFGARKNSNNNNNYSNNNYNYNGGGNYGNHSFYDDGDQPF